MTLRARHITPRTARDNLRSSESCKRLRGWPGEPVPAGPCPGRYQPPPDLAAPLSSFLSPLAFSFLPFSDFSVFSPPAFSSARSGNEIRNAPASSAARMVFMIGLLRGWTVVFGRFESLAIPPVHGWSPATSDLRFVTRFALVRERPRRPPERSWNLRV